MTCLPRPQVGLRVRRNGVALGALSGRAAPTRPPLGACTGAGCSAHEPSMLCCTMNEDQPSAFLPNMV